MFYTRSGFISQFVMRLSERLMNKAAGAKYPEAWQYAALRTFCADNAVRKSCSPACRQAGNCNKRGLLNRF